MVNVEVWVPKTHPPRSCNHAVFVDEAAQDVGSLEVRAVGLTGRSRSEMTNLAGQHS